MFSAGANIALSATASDPDGTVTKVEFFAGTTSLGAVAVAPYTLTWSNAPGGSYVLTAKATDDRGATTTSSPVSITVSGPTATITSPAGGTSFVTPATIPIKVNATSATGTIAKLDFYDGSTLLGTINAGVANVSATFTYANVPGGTHLRTAKATDNAGLSYTPAPVTVSVNAAPTVTLTSPTDGSAFAAPATITLTASASVAGGSVAQVDFYQGSTLLGSSATA